MSKGVLSEQHLVIMTKLVEKMLPSQDFFFSNSGLFPETNWDSDTIQWEIAYMSGGMTPFVAPGTQAPVVGGDGIGSKNASVAFMKEKTYLDEVLLNNLRKPGSWATKESAERQIARRTRKLVYRCDARKEWMCAKAMVAGAFSYQDKNGMRLSVDYNIPPVNKITLAGNYVWGAGSSRVPQQDMFNLKQALAENFGVVPSTCVMNTNTLKLLLWDSTVSTLLEKSRYGEGDLYKNPSLVLGDLLGVGPITIYDKMYDVPAVLMSTITGASSTTITVDDATDFEVGGTLRITDMTKENTWEDRAITGVNKTTNVITIGATTTNSYNPGTAKVTMKRRFVPDKTVLLYANSVDGEAVGEYALSPYGMSPAKWGRQLDSHEEWDPSGVWLRVQSKGLPFLWHPEAVAIMTVG